MSALTNKKMINVNGRDFLIQRLEALDKDRKHLHDDIRKAGFDPFDLEAEVLKRRASSCNEVASDASNQEYDL